MTTPAALAITPLRGALPGPQTSSPQPAEPTAARRLIRERNRESDMGDHRIAEAIVLDCVFENAFEPGRCPAATELDRFAEHAELCLHRVAGEAGQLDVVGDELGHLGVVRRIAGA